jgi:predicted DNA-binding transcriptional regulator AlpA
MTPQQEQIYNDLKDRYKKSTLSKRELATELGISYSTIDGYISKGLGIPNYKKLGTAKNAKVIFNIIDVSEFLSQTIKTA